MRVLEIMGSLHRGGAENMIMNYYRAFDKELCQMDFVVHAEFENDFREEAKKLGAKIIVLPQPGKVGAFKYINLLVKAIKENGPYDAIHSHVDAQSFLSVIAAKLCKIKKIIVHSHTTRYSKIKLFINRMVFASFRVVRLACGEKAGKAFYGKKKFTVISNAIDASAFKEHIKNQANAPSRSSKTKIIGHLGRFFAPKNHEFIVSLAKELKEKQVDACIHLYGKGALEEHIKSLVKDANVEDYVHFMGLTKNPIEAYLSFDLFILPSLFEGFPVTLVEAQLANLPCLVSDSISKECDLELGLLTYLPLDADTWAKEITKCFEENRTETSATNSDIIANYDVSIQWKRLLSIYKS